MSRFAWKIYWIVTAIVFLITVTAKEAPRFKDKQQRLSVCAPNLSSLVSATDPDGDRIVYSILGGNSVTMDYTIDAVTGLVKSLRSFHINDHSLLTIQATDTDNSSSTTLLNITYIDCGSKLVKPDVHTRGKLLEPVFLQPTKATPVKPSSSVSEEVVVKGLNIFSRVAVLLVPRFLTFEQPTTYFSPAELPLQTRTIALFQQDYLKNIRTNPLTNQVPANTPVARLIISGGKGPFRWSSIDSRFGIFFSGANVADVMTMVNLPRGIYPFIIQVDDLTQVLSAIGYIRIILS